MTTYKYLGSEGETHYYTRIFDLEDDETSQLLQAAIYKHHVDIGMIKSLSGRVVIYEFSTVMPLLNLTILHHINSTYRVKSPKDFESYDRVLKKYLRFGSSNEDVVVNLSLIDGKEGSVVMGSKNKSSLKKEEGLNKKVQMDNLVIRGFDVVLPVVV